MHTRVPDYIQLYPVLKFTARTGIHRYLPSRVIVDLGTYVLQIEFSAAYLAESQFQYKSESVYRYIFETLVVQANVTVQFKTSLRGVMRTTIRLHWFGGRHL